MAQSIKLNNNMYWDLSSIKGAAEQQITFTPNSTYLNNNAVRVRKSLNNVLMQVSLNIKALEASTNTYIVGTIPSEYAPAYSVNFVIQKINSRDTLLGQIDSTGEIEVSNGGVASTAGWYDGSLMWFNV